jgi:hypothetical protein
MNYKSEMIKFFKNYSKTIVNEEYKVKVDLSYSYGKVNDKLSRKWIRNLKNHFNSKGFRFEGLYVNEFSKLYRLHNHCVFWFSCDLDLGKKLIKDYWKKIGTTDIDSYNPNENYCEYMLKYIDYNSKSSWEFIENL